MVGLRRRGGRERGGRGEGKGLPEKSGSLRTKSKRATMNIRVPLVLESYAINGMTTAYFYLL